MNPALRCGLPGSPARVRDRFDERERQRAAPGAKKKFFAQLFWVTPFRRHSPARVRDRFDERERQRAAPGAEKKFFAQLSFKKAGLA